MSDVPLRVVMSALEAIHLLAGLLALALFVLPIVGAAIGLIFFDTGIEDR